MWTTCCSMLCLGALAVVPVDTDMHLKNKWTQGPRADTVGGSLVSLRFAWNEEKCFIEASSFHFDDIIPRTISSARPSFRLRVTHDTGRMGYQQPALNKQGPTTSSVQQQVVFLRSSDIRTTNIHLSPATEHPLFAAVVL